MATVAPRRTARMATWSVRVNPVPSESELLRWSEALAGIARTGLGFTQSLYERERYEEVLKVAADIRAAAGAADADPAHIERDIGAWLASVGEGVPGYVTPKVAVGALVGNDAGELLLVQRADSGMWLYPTGWADPGYSPSEVVVKEVAEETGVDAEPIRLVAVLDGLRFGLARFAFYSLVFQCRALGGTLRCHPLECADVGWFARESLPTPLAGGGRWVSWAFGALEGHVTEARFDPPRQPVWRDADHVELGS